MTAQTFNKYLIYDIIIDISGQNKAKSQEIIYSRPTENIYYVIFD